MASIMSIAIRLGLAVVLGGLIGYERGNTQRPAGFRTHILVCVGSALVMITSEYIFSLYHEIVNLDPARLGAQVISGIGFLGAGTIIRDGVNVKGLTTAASLWAVSCVGIAVGIGLYGGAVLATLTIFITLFVLKNFEPNINKTRRYRIVYIQSEVRPNWIGDLCVMLEKNDIQIKNIEFNKNFNNENIFIKLLVKFPDNPTSIRVIKDIQNMPGIIKVNLK